MSSEVLSLTEATFDEEVRASQVPVLLEFWAEWCPPCKAIAPVLDELAADYEGRLRVLKVNADEHPELARRYEVASVPTMLVFSDGVVQRRMVGPRGRARLLEDMEDLIS